MGDLFGTDGVRGIANSELTPELALQLGRAASALADERNRAVIGRDPRRSGEMLEAALATGMASVGIDVLEIGVIPTPAIPFFVQELEASFGAVISASHNPAPDNGIKFFNPQGFKIPVEMEDRLEEAVNKGVERRPTGAEIGRIERVDDAQHRYIGFLIGKVAAGMDFSGIKRFDLKMIVDCANGATSAIAAQLFSHFGLETIVINDSPDGDNINLGCGSTDMRMLQEAVRLYDADLGVAYDGDGDRALMVDHEGRVVDGDEMMVISALALQRSGKLDPPLVVSTVMSNMGMEEALAKHGIEVVRTPVGDRYVAEKIEETGALLGGEQSGHIIFRRHSTTGDGLITTLKVLEIIKKSGRSLAELASQMKRYPQVLHNIEVQDQRGFSSNSQLARAILEMERRLGQAGRILVRPSGTQPLIRIMVEGKDKNFITQLAAELRNLIDQELNL